MAPDANDDIDAPVDARIAAISDATLDAIIGQIMDRGPDLGALLDDITQQHGLTSHQAALLIAHFTLNIPRGDDERKRTECRALLTDMWRVHPVQNVTILRRGIRTWTVPNGRVLKTTIQIGHDVRVTRIGDTGDPTLVALNAESHRA